MRYHVTIGGRELVVDVDGGRVSVDGRELEAHLTSVPGTPLRHLLAGTDSLSALVARGEGGGWVLEVEGARYEVEAVDERTRHIRSLTGGGASRGGPAQLKAPMPGLVVRVMVTPGQAVAVGQGLVVLEAMKMENELRASSAGVVAAIPAVQGQAVEKGQVLVEFEAPSGG